MIRPFPCEDGEDGGGCCENVLGFGNELGRTLFFLRKVPSSQRRVFRGSLALMPVPCWLLSAWGGHTPARRREGLQPCQRGPRAALLTSGALPAPHEAFRKVNRSG